ncbi:hypothetical protein DXG01_013501 [Tephrocybe rancida]|nr:hypothetical protein DXG01_013501 [Tephrocybe rancida]
MISTKNFQRPNSIKISTSAAHREDSQPNEGINKRQNPGPPAVVPAALPPVGGHQWNGQYPNRGNNTWRGGRGGGHRGFRQGPQPFRPMPHDQYMAPPETSAWQQTGYYRVNQASGPVPSKNHYRRPESNRGLSLRHLSDTPRSPPLHDQWPKTDEPVPAPSGSSHSTGASNGTQLSTKPMPILPVPIAQQHDGSNANHETFNKSLPIQRTSAPSPKRRRVEPPLITSLIVKIEDDDIEIIDHIRPSDSSPLTITTLPGIKLEQRSLSPAPLIRRLVTQACALYPLPNNCRKMNPKSNPEYVKHRSAFVAKERAVLKRKGLKATNVLFRDDGMVIEWTSPVPVWSDTLLPEPPQPTQKIVSPRPLPLPTKKRKEPESSLEHTSDTVTSTNISNLAPTSSGPSTKKPIPMPLPVPGKRPQRQDEEDQEEEQEEEQEGGAGSLLLLKIDKGKGKEVTLPTARPRPRPLPKPRPRTIAAPAMSEEEVLQAASMDIIEIPQPSTDIASQWSADELEQFEPMALDYLHRYIKAFDVGASELRPAYAPHAFFSCRTPSQSKSAPVCQGRSAIKRALTHLSSYKFLPEGHNRDLHMHYDVVPLCVTAGGGLLLTVYGEIVDSSAQDGVEMLGLDQVFVLDKDMREDAWPLSAVSHQMVIRKVVDGIARGVASVEEFSWLNS